MIGINQVWPEWHEECLLGEGSFGKVYRAKRVEFGRTFYSAIKVISVPKSQQEVRTARSQGMNDNDIYRYFQSLVDSLLNEITLMDNLKGAKNIVGIDDYKIIEHEGEIGWEIFIRMELLTPFDSFISNPEFSQKDVIRLGVDICSALEACEQNNIIHRDIKPDNIFVSRFGEYKLGDFGIARKLEATQANLSRKGTLNYMAPEVYKSEEYGSGVDIYSLGLVLYTLLNNNRIAFLPPYPQPITYKNNEEALSMRLSGMPLDPPCNAGQSLGDVVLKACAFRPEDRYATATEFKNALIIEWNALLRSGENTAFADRTMFIGPAEDDRLEHTTNDMTANGRLVVDEFLKQGTTVLENDQYAVSGDPPQYIPLAKTPKKAAKSSKFCRIAAYPLFAVAVVLAILILTSGELAVERSAAFSILAAGVVALIAPYNKIAIGLSMGVSSIGYIFEGLYGLVGGLSDSFSVYSVILTVCGLLILAGGISIAVSREARSGGAMFLYVIALEWLPTLYMMINLSLAVQTWHIYFTVAELAGFVWAFGYNSAQEISGYRKALRIATFFFAGAAAVFAIMTSITAVRPLLG